MQTSAHNNRWFSLWKISSKLSVENLHFVGLSKSFYKLRNWTKYSNVVEIWVIYVISVGNKEHLYIVAQMQQAYVYPVTAMSIQQMLSQDVINVHSCVRDATLNRFLSDVLRRGCLFVRIVIGWGIQAQMKVLSTRDKWLIVTLAALQLPNFLQSGHFF
ncbi:unnamed protein product [Fraxinus pennsylvanica]|uniref:Uncharacterized protein n=1 Tax=Fraxinus pennsylvanica TaxID=56036 RepID=A0AAD2E2Q6_9LAMI|nr:unnamed protein product [Fraxinus pennsylvanica]